MINRLKSNPIAKILLALLVSLLVALTAYMQIRRLTRDINLEHDVRILLLRMGIEHGYVIDFSTATTLRFTAIHSSQRFFDSAPIGLDEETIDTFDYKLYISTGRKVPSISSSPNYIANQWEVELSYDQITTLTNLARNTITLRRDRPFVTLHATGSIPYALAIINDRLYWTLYTPNTFDIPDSRSMERHMVNNNLTSFLHEILSLSPYPIQGWPIPSNP